MVTRRPVLAATALAAVLVGAPTFLHRSAHDADAVTASELTTPYTGKDRKVAKTSIVDDNDIEEFSSVAALIKDLDKDPVMRKLGITKQSTKAKRVAQENENVRLEAWLYAAKAEDDGDFHLIIGDQPGGTVEYLTCEISGLPAKTSRFYKRLKQARGAFLTLLADESHEAPGEYKYEHYSPPIKVEVMGSLFFDIDHGAGTVGPLNPRRRSTTAWEVHPVVEIKRAAG